MPDIMPISEWQTIISKMRPAKKGKFGIFKRPIVHKRLDMNEIFGYDSALFMQPAEITMLYEGDKNPEEDPKGVWMSDSPFELYGMWQLTSRAKPGKILVGGLGLGILSNLLANREDIESVTVVEISPEVIELVKPYLHSKVKVIQGDFLMEMQKLEHQGETYDTIISDIYKTCDEPKDEELFEDTRMMIDDTYPAAEQLHWCFQEKLEEDIVKYYLIGREIEQQRAKEKRQSSSIKGKLEDWQKENGYQR